MEHEHDSNSVEEVEETVMDDGYDDSAAEAVDHHDYRYPEDDDDDDDGDDRRYAETEDITVMDTQTGGIIEMEGEVCSMDTEAVDVGCKDSPPIPDKAARDLSKEQDQLTAKDQDEFLRKTPEKLKLDKDKDAPWHKEELKEPAVEEKAPPIPIKRGNTKSRIDMFEAM